LRRSGRRASFALAAAVSLTTGLSVTPDAEPEVSVTSEAKQYVIPAKPYITKPFTFVQPAVCSDRELALKFTNGMRETL
jgi:hypothetical protein